MRSDFDLAIVGSGFGGSLLAMIARRLGLSVALLERGRHPRFAIGESTSPLANLILEELALRYDLPRLIPLTTYGAWQRTYPEVICGRKRGFMFFHHRAGQTYRADADRSNQLLVAASPRDEVADTHWLRADVDHFLLNEAISLGAEYLDEVKLTRAAWSDESKALLEGERHGRSLQLSARLVIDATGPRGFLSRALNLPESTFPCFPPTQSRYTHFTGVLRCDAMDAFRPTETPPYRLDDAAVHHVFDGGWMWVLRFNNDVVSAGVALVDAFANEIGLSEEGALRRFLNRYPSIAEQFAEATPIRPDVYASRLPYRSAVAAGTGWALLPSAAAFVDPLFSTGIPLTLLGIERLSRILEETWGTSALAPRLQEYGETTLSEVDTTALFIAACYAGMSRFPLFSAYSMFYFAAASYSEMARRLGSARIGRYLAADHPAFGGALRRNAETLLRRADDMDAAEMQAFERRITEEIACLNIAGLSDPAKRNWYGVDLEDLIRDAERLGRTPEEMRRILAAASWA